MRGKRMSLVSCRAKAIAQAAMIVTALMGAQISPVFADPVAEFYRGKSIDLAIGFGAGGGYDVYSRTLARHLGDFIPCNPVVVPRNLPGGGGLVSANYIYNAAPRDGLHMAMFGSFNGMEPLYGNANA